MKNHVPGVLGILGLAGLVGLYFVVRRFFPAFSALLVTLAGIVAFGIVALVVLALVFAFHKPKPKTQGDSGQAALLQKGRSDLLTLHQLALRVKEQRVRTSCERVCLTIQKILDALKEQPEDIPGARQLFSYYLPTLGGILQRYLRLEQSGVPAADTTEKVIACLGSIHAAMEKLYAGLFDDDKLDLTVEMKVLQQFCQNEGLLTDPASPAKDDGEGEPAVMHMGGH